jgi:hypothetical protein
MFKSQFMNRDQSASNEATSAPIFLFQRRKWIVTGVPDGYDFFDEGIVAAVDDDGNPKMTEDGDYAEVLSEEQLAEHNYGDWDVPCAIETWEVDRVFLTRQEAEEYGNARAYNYRDGWRVYSVNCVGELAQALRDGSEFDAKKVDSPST